MAKEVKKRKEIEMLKEDFFKLLLSGECAVRHVFDDKDHVYILYNADMDSNLVLSMVLQHSVECLDESIGESLIDES